MAIFCIFIIVSLIIAIVIHILYRKHKREEEFSYQLGVAQLEKINNAVAEILSFGGLCSQTDADGWREYKLIEWKYEPKCYVKNVDGSKTLVICPISFSFGSREVASLKRIVDDIAYDKIIKSEIVFGADAWAYLEICIDMSDVVFAQPYYHRLSECIGCVYCPVDSYLSETCVAH